MFLKSKPPNLQKNVSLVKHTTFRIGGAARYFCITRNEEEIMDSLKFAEENNFKIFVMGGGSNLLVADSGFDGLVIKIQTSNFKLEENIIFADAGVNLNKLVLESVQNNLTGLEWAVGIPGTIGGAVFGNTGAYGHSISECVVKVRTVSYGGELKEYFKKDCGFIYRGSCFKMTGAGEVILKVELELSVGNKEESQKIINETMAQRKTKIPLFPSAGSFFKNYKIAEKNLDENKIIKKFPEVKEKIRSGKIPVGYLIEQCGLKGKQIGGAMIANEHTNFIVNSGGATAGDVIALINLCKEEVKKKYGIEIETEKRLVGF